MNAELIFPPAANAQPLSAPIETRSALFQKKEIRKTLHADDWWYVIVDVVAALTDSANPGGYLMGEANCPPFFAGVHDRRRPADTHVLAHRGYLPPDPVDPQPQGQAVQTAGSPKWVMNALGKSKTPNPLIACPATPPPDHPRNPPVVHQTPWA